MVIFDIDLGILVYLKVILSRATMCVCALCQHYLATFIRFYLDLPLCRKHGQIGKLYLLDQ